jgi:5-methyltetrahydrofolate--homocysteine methyltransferase
MVSKNSIKRRLKKNILILDGATGTELQKSGMPAGASPELWCLENPGAVIQVQSAYRDSGCDVIYTPTFGANRFKLGDYGADNVKEINCGLAKLSRSAAGKRCLVAGDIGPTGKFVEPFGELGFEEAVNAFKEQALGLLEGGVDLFAIETMMDIQEARAALIGVREACGLFTIVTMTYERDGRTLNGTDPVSALITLQSLGADAVGCNCSSGPEEMLSLIRLMRPYAKVPLVAKPNAGLPRLESGRTLFDMDPARFASFGKPFAAEGVCLLGGCCGTTPSHLRELARSVDGARPIAPARKSISALSSTRKAIILEDRKPLVIVGERINPTGKKIYREALEKGLTDMSIVREMARDQEKLGAGLLDVNVGTHGIDEPAIMKKAVAFLSGITDLPLAVDSPKVEAIEAALRLYPGRMLINSISGEREKVERLLPIAAKYGAMFILLPLTDGEVPETAQRRKEIVKSVYSRAARLGFTRDDFVVDGLVMTVASNPKAAGETLEMIDWCSRKFGVKTIMGLSNVSFGLPARNWTNASFLAMAVERGLTMAIANPSHSELMNVKAASDLLAGRDSGAKAYISYFSEKPGPEKPAPLSESPRDSIRRAVLEGDKDSIKTLIDRAVSAGDDPFALVQDIMIPAVTRVGELFEKREYFLPQLIAGAEAMKAGVDHLEPLLREKTAFGDKGAVMIATVEGDIHDIGKNIVSLLLRNHGFRVIDLGKDVPADRILETAQRERPDVIGLSALMTTTMVRMKEVIELARERKTAGHFILGGAVVTRSFAESLGAAYAKDGVEAVKVITGLINRK